MMLAQGREGGGEASSGLRWLRTFLQWSRVEISIVELQRPLRRLERARACWQSSLADCECGVVIGTLGELVCWEARVLADWSSPEKLPKSSAIQNLRECKSLSLVGCEKVVARREKGELTQVLIRSATAYKGPTYLIASDILRPDILLTHNQPKKME